MHGTQGIDTQVINSIGLIHSITLLEENFLDLNYEVQNCVISMMGRTHATWQHLTNSVYRIGSLYRRILTFQESSAIKRKFQVTDLSVRCFLQIFIQNTDSFVYGSFYKKLIRRNQSVVKYVTNSEPAAQQYGSVQFFAILGEGDLCVAFIAPFKLKQKESTDRMKEVIQDPDLEVIKLDQLLCSCIYIEDNDSMYLCEIPNRCDNEKYCTIKVAH